MENNSMYSESYDINKINIENEKLQNMWNISFQSIAGRMQRRNVSYNTREISISIVLNGTWWHLTPLGEQI